MPTPEGLQGVEGFVVALFFGAVSVWLHAVNQFNRSTYEQSKEFYRLLDKLRPSDLRKGDVYRQAFLFYAVILTLIYLAVVALITVPGLQQFAQLIPGLSTLGQSVGAAELPKPEYIAGVAFDETGGFANLKGVDPMSGLNPAIPLAVSLAVVGLAPNVPGLYRLEEFVRSTAHRLSGIPTHLVNAALALRHADLLSHKAQTGPELQQSDWDRLDAYRKAIDPRIENVERFHADVTKIVVLRRWILEQSLFAPYLPISTKYRLAEKDVRERVTATVRDLDRASGFATPENGRPPDQTDGRRARPDWPALMAAAEDTAEDLCLLVVLYEEHHALQMANQGAGDKDQADARLSVARKYLESISNLMVQANIDNVASGLFSRLTVGILLIAFAGSVVSGWLFAFGALEPGTRTIGLAKHGLIITLSAAVTYVPALFFTLTFQQSSYVSVPRVWENAFLENARRSRWLPQLAICALIAVAVAFLFRLGYHFYFVISAAGIEVVRERLWVVLDYALVQEFAFALQGSVLAIAMALVIDAWRAGRLPALRWWFYLGLPLALAAAAVLGLAALHGWSGLAERAGRGALAAASHFGLATPPGQPPTPGYKEAWQLFVETILPALLTGIVASAYAIGFLRDEFPDVYKSGAPRLQPGE